MRSLRLHFFLLMLIGILSFASLPLRAADTASLDSRRAQLKQLLADEWEYELREAPERATVIGDYRYNDRWSDSSLTHVQQRKSDLQQWLSRFEAINTADFSEQEKLNQRLILRNLEQRIEEIDLKLYEMPVDQFNSAHLPPAPFVA